MKRILRLLVITASLGAYSANSLADDIFLDPYWKMPERTFAVPDFSGTTVDLSFKRDYTLVDNYNP
jgi:hypothetical protein